MAISRITDKLEKLYFTRNLFSEIVNTCKQHYPQYTRGLITSKGNPMEPTKVYFFEDNLRSKDDVFEEYFEKFGPYYKKHKGFVTNPTELVTIENEISRNKETICGIFHVHIDFPACPTKLDIETFSQTVLDTENIWYLIISFLIPEELDVRAFWINNKLIREIEIIIKEVGE